MVAGLEPRKERSPVRNAWKAVLWGQSRAHWDSRKAWGILAQVSRWEPHSEGEETEAIPRTDRQSRSCVTGELDSKEGSV